MPQRSIMAPVSTILLQENSFKPAQSAGFFFALRFDLAQCFTWFSRHRALYKPGISVDPSQPKAFAELRMSLRYVMSASQTLPILDSSAVHATDMRDGRQVCRAIALHTHRTTSLGPILGCARHLSPGGHFFMCSAAQKTSPGPCTSRTFDYDEVRAPLQCAQLALRPCVKPTKIGSRTDECSIA